MLKKIRSQFASGLKKLDAVTCYKVGRLFRRMTNVNTARYWDKKLASYGKSWRDFPYRHMAEFLPEEGEFSLADQGLHLPRRKNIAD